jgi:hypothetical protein
VNGAFAKANCPARYRGHELLGVAHDVIDLRARAVPFEHRELGVVMRSALALAKARCELIDMRIALRQEALHLVLGRGTEPARCSALALDYLEGVEVQIEPRRNDHRRGLDFEKAASVEEPTHRRANLRALAQQLHFESTIVVRGVSPLNRIWPSWADAQARPPRSAFPSAHVIAIPSSAPKMARAAKWGVTSLRISPVA